MRAFRGRTVKLESSPGSESFSIAIAETGRRIALRTHRLPLPDGNDVAMCVPCGKGDDITAEIVRGTFRIPAHYRLLEALVPKPGRVVDLGAHIGTFAAYAAALGHEVIAVDASECNIALLRETMKINAFDRVRAVHAAISDTPGHLEFTEFGAYGVVASPLLKWPTVRVPAVTVDQLLADSGWSDADFVKMDVEGSEMAALRGMDQLLAKGDAALVFESNGHTLHLYGQSPTALLNHLHRAQYRSWAIQGNRLVPVTPHHVQFECLVDYLALTDESRAIPGWRYRAPRRASQQFAVAVSACRHANPHVRAHVGRTLQQADAALRGDRRIDAALRALARDSEASVRESVSWFPRSSRETLPGQDGVPS